MLKAQLQEQLKAVEDQERMMEQAARPKTMEEADEMEKKLTRQLEELRSHKSTLRGQSGQSGAGGEQGGRSGR